MNDQINELTNKQSKPIDSIRLKHQLWIPICLYCYQLESIHLTCALLVI